MRCKQCGMEFREGATFKFCPTCGETVDWTEDSGYPAPEPSFAKQQTVYAGDDQTGDSGSDAGYPAEEAAAPVADAAYPNEEAAAPVADVAYPSEEAAAPVADAAYPSEENAAPVADAAYPSEEAVFPNTDAGYPGADAGYPGADAGYPNADAGYPGADAGYPGADAGYPGADAGYPGADAGYPNANAGYPGVNTGYPGSETAYPPVPQGFGPGFTNAAEMPNGQNPPYPGMNQPYQQNPAFAGAVPPPAPAKTAAGAGNAGDFFKKYKLFIFLGAGILALLLIAVVLLIVLKNSLSKEEKVVSRYYKAYAAVDTADLLGMVPKDYLEGLYDEYNIADDAEMKEALEDYIWRQSYYDYSEDSKIKYDLKMKKTTTYSKGKLADQKDKLETRFYMEGFDASDVKAMADVTYKWTLYVDKDREGGNNNATMTVYQMGGKWYSYDAMILLKDAAYISTR